jgi:long-subunit fatty acid transport protein
MSLSAAMPDQTGSPNTVQQRGGGLSDSLSSAFQFGACYDIDPTIKIGATYTTSTPLRFQKLFDFDRNGSYDDFAVDLPAELGIGVSKKWNAWQFSVDVKQIYWSAANGFKHLLWKDQTVVGLGVAYEWIPNKLVVRGGYNYSPSVVSDRSDLSAQNGFNSISSGQFFDSNVSFFNLAGFGPAAAGQHSFTLGAGYKITPNLNFDFGAQYLLQNTVTQTGKTSLAGPNDTNALYSARNSGVIVSTALTWSL